jgi:hypothetical protein
MLGIALLLAGTLLAMVAGHFSGGAATALFVLCALVLLVLRGLTAVVPGQARVSASSPLAAVTCGGQPRVSSGSTSATAGTMCRLRRARRAPWSTAARWRGWRRRIRRPAPAYLYVDANDKHRLILLHPAPHAADAALRAPHDAGRLPVRDSAARIRTSAPHAAPPAAAATQMRSCTSRQRCQLTSGGCAPRVPSCRPPSATGRPPLQVDARGRQPRSGSRRQAFQVRS